MLTNSRRIMLVLMAGILLSLVGQSASSAASSAAINSAFKNIYKKLAASGNTDAITVLTYYDVEVKKAIGKIIDRKVGCDVKSKNRYKVIAFDTSQPEVAQLINGFYLGFCNSQ
jgi:hypothetical protein